MAQLPGVRREFVQAAMVAPFLERDEERQLAVRWRETRDQRALDQIAGQIEIGAELEAQIAVVGIVCDLAPTDDDQIADRAQIHRSS